MQVVHLRTTKESVNKKRKVTLDCQAFVISHDLHVCGACKMDFDDVVQFLFHKAEHSLENYLFKCNLCKVIVSSKELLINHYNTGHQLSMYSKSTSNVENGNSSLLNEGSIIGNGTSVESVPRGEGVPQASSPPEIQQKSSSKSSNGKRKSKLQVKPMLEGSILEEVLGLPCSLDNDFQKLDGTREFGFSMSDGIELNVGNGDFSQVANIGEDDIGTKESQAGHVASRRKEISEPFELDFLRVSESSARSQFGRIGSWLHCRHCNFRTRRSSVLSSHLANLHGAHEARPHGSTDSCRMENQRQVQKSFTDAYPCTVCGKEFTRFRYLRKHLETHHAEKKFACDDCGKSYKSRTYLRVHRRVHQKKEFSCNQCSFVSSVSAAIRAHRQIHNSGSAICDICGHAYIDRSTLGKHKRVHDLSRPFACNFPGCKWRFKTEVMCRAHIRAHTTQGKFRCAVCGYVFRQKHHLQRHELHMHTTKLGDARSPACQIPPTEHEDYLANDDSNHFPPITGLDVIRDLSSDLPAEFGQSQLLSVPDSSVLPLTFMSSDLSLIGVDCRLLNIEELSFAEDEKHVNISELEVFN